MNSTLELIPPRGKGNCFLYLLSQSLAMSCSPFPDPRGPGGGGLHNFLGEVAPLWVKAIVQRKEHL